VCYDDAYYQGQYEVAQRLDEESLAIWRRERDQQAIAWELQKLGTVILARGDFGAAYDLYVNSLNLARDLSWQFGLACSLTGFARLSAAEGRPAAALRLAGAADALRELLRTPLSPAELAEFEDRLAQSRRVLGGAAAESAWVEGRMMSVDQVIDTALRRET
jgi:tetratricopeptide (TPR) repeat protein